MRKQIRWSARELLTKYGFDDGLFPVRYHSVFAQECVKSTSTSLGIGSYVLEDEYTHYVLCLVDLLYARGLQYIVLHDPDADGHNLERIDSFVYDGELYIVKSGDPHWFTTLPSELQRIFEE